MFRVVPLPIIRSAYNCIYSIWYLSHRYCYLPRSWKSWNVVPSLSRQPRQPSSGAHTTVSTASGICRTVTATCRYRGRVGTQFHLFRDSHDSHHQEHIQLYLQHLVFVAPLLLSADVVEELERNSNSSTIAITRSAYTCIYSIWYLSHRYCYLPRSWKSWNVVPSLSRQPRQPSSGVHTTVSTASGICHTVTATCRCRGRVGMQFQLFHDSYDSHHQERIQLYLQHLVFVTPLLLSADVVEELELV